MGSKIGFEMSLIVVEAIRGRCANFTIQTATVSEIFGRQTILSIFVVYIATIIIISSLVLYNNRRHYRNLHACNFHGTCILMVY